MDARVSAMGTLTNLGEGRLDSSRALLNGCHGEHVARLCVLFEETES